MKLIGIKMKIPCENCLCLSLCRHKSFFFLSKECSLIYIMLYEKSGHRKRTKHYEEVVVAIETYMNPSKWATENTWINGNEWLHVYSKTSKNWNELNL
jgi:hypothetical protein